MRKKLKDESAKYTMALVTPDALYEYNRLPGFIYSLTCYQQPIDKPLSLLKVRFAFVYIGDVLIPSESFNEGLENLRTVINMPSTAGFLLNSAK